MTRPDPVRTTMDIVVFGKHAEVDASLRAHTIEKIQRISKFANDVRRVEVDYDEIPTKRASDSHSCEILVHLKHHLVKGHASAVDQRAALDLALDKAEYQMRRLHDRRTRRGGRRSAPGNGPQNGADERAEDVLGDLAPFDDAAAEADGSGPTIVKTKHFEVKPMHPNEAALQMELLGHDFFLFTNAESSRAAVLYRRRDGHFGLIEASG